MASRTGAIVLAGGGSRRMGRDKVWLDWHGTPLLVRVVDVVAQAVDGPVVVVRAAGQELPALPGGVAVVEDSVAGRGPLQGLHDGLEALRGRADLAFASATDTPLLHPAFVRRVLGALGEADAAIPVVGRRRHPLLAAYRVSLAPVAAALLDEGVRELGRLAERCRALLLDEAALVADPALAAADPGLRSVLNVNTPEEYDAALALGAGGLSPPGD